MPEAPVHEHVGDQLEGLEEGRGEIEQRECFVHEFLGEHRDDKHYRIDYYKILDYKRHSRPVISSVIVHNCLSISSSVKTSMHLCPEGDVSGSAHENNVSTKSRASSPESLPL